MLSAKRKHSWRMVIGQGNGWKVIARRLNHQSPVRFKFCANLRRNHQNLNGRRSYTRPCDAIVSKVAREGRHLSTNHCKGSLCHVIDVSFDTWFKIMRTRIPQILMTTFLHWFGPITLKKKVYSMQAFWRFGININNIEIIFWNWNNRIFVDTVNKIRVRKWN